VKVGDLVKFFNEESHLHRRRRHGRIGIIVDEELPSKILNETANRKLVQWESGARRSYPERQLVVINESR
jgi:predicted nucleotidyltransferase